MPDDDTPKEPFISHDEAFRRFTKAHKPEGGIKAQSKRGKMAQTWWAARWIAVLESFDIGGRLGRGKSYARKGQVIDIEVDKGKVKSSVQGSQRQPYDVTIEVNELSKPDWRRLAKVLAGKAIFAAKLLAGQMPEEIEAAFKEAGLSLFPTKGTDLKTKCSCPDYSNPCKHIAAVYYLLGEEFDRDPFLIFRLRGITRDEIMDYLDEEIAGGKRPKSAPKSNVVALNTAEDAVVDAIESDYKGYWRMGELPAELLGDLHPPEANAMLPRRLGPFPFWRGETDFWQTIDRMYRLGSANSLKLFGTDAVNTKKGSEK
jgi:uncharacterized Zn finger protein